MADGIGRRIAVQRRRRGLSQVALAGLVGRSESWLSQVERGRRLDSYSALHDLARVLRVDVDLLAEGEPGSAAAPTTEVSDGRLTAVERALFGRGAAEAVDVADVVRQTHEDYQAAQYDTVLDGLAGLIGVLDPGLPDPLLASGYTVTAKMLTKVGAADLALVAAGALRAADFVDPDRLPKGLRSRRVQVQLDLAWAQAQRRRDADALVALLEVERSAPQVTRVNAVARDTIRHLLGRARGTTGASVRALADRAGITVS